MRRGSQLVLESSIVGALLISIVLGGGIATLSVPRQWSILVNPASVPAVQEPNALSSYYNRTFSSLGTGHYSNVSLLLDTFRFVNIPAGLNQTALVGNSQIASMNVTMPKAAFDFQVAANLIAERQFLNASAYVATGCEQAAKANATLSDFKGSTVPQLTSLGVPLQPYAIGLGLTSDEVSSLLAKCAMLQSPSPYPAANLTIGSLQKSVETGGNVTLFGNLTLNGEGIPGQTVFFYFNGTFIGTISSSSSGKFGGTLSIPFVYEPAGVVQALVRTNNTAGFSGATSNSLRLLVLFSGTRIIVADPPAYLPTFSFGVHGNLTTTHGVPLPGAPVKVTFLNEIRNATTDSSGVFGAVFTVPANTQDGFYYVYAAFAPRGAYGPSFNFTSIEVIHEHLNMTVKVSSLTLSGFSASVRGQLTANGTGVAGAKVTVSSPWGSIQTTSNSTGGYALSVPTSLLDFAFVGGLRVSAVPAQPYVAPGEVPARLGLFNLLIVVIPAIAIGAVGYGARSLGLLKGKPKYERVTTTLPSEEKTALLEPTTLEKDMPRMLLLYLQTLRLATERFQINFGRNLTLREMAAKIGGVADQRGGSISAQILMMTEDFLYAETFNEARIKEAEGYAAELRELWKK